MVQSMRAIGPRDPDLVVNALVDYPVIWNWLLTAVFYLFLKLIISLFALYKLVYLTFCDAESFCPRF